MNCFDVGAERKAGGQWWGMIRLPKNGKMVPVCEKGVPVYYSTKADALYAAGKTICTYINGRMRRDGDVMGRVMAEADALFRRD